MDYTIRYVGNRYAGRVDDGTKALTPGAAQFEATGPIEAFDFTPDHKLVKVIDRERVTIVEYRVL